MAAYIVQPGDYPARIAAKFGMSMTEFMQMNPGLCSSPNQCNVIYPGQTLQVRGASGAATAATPVSQPAWTGSGPQPPPWMQKALGEQGVHEWNPGDNPRIKEYLASVGLSGPDETSWCSAFVNWCMKKSGYNGTGSGLASSWKNYGRAVGPTYGAVVVFQPLSAGASGHVGLLHALESTRVWILSGNSGNQVRISAYPREKLVPGYPYRWPY